MDKKRYHTNIKFTPYIACGIAEGFDGDEHTEEELHDAWQFLVDSGLAWTLQGWYGRNAARLIEEGLILPAKVVNKN